MKVFQKFHQLKKKDQHYRRNFNDLFLETVKIIPIFRILSKNNKTIDRFRRLGVQICLLPKIIHFALESEEFRRGSVGGLSAVSGTSVRSRGSKRSDAQR